MDQFIGVLWKFGVVELFEFVNREFERVDLTLELGHQLLGVSRLSEFQDLFVELDAFLLLLYFLFLFDVAALGERYDSYGVSLRICLYIRNCECMRYYQILLIKLLEIKFR